MTLEQCVDILTPLALAMRADMDVPTFRAYHQVLRDVSPGCFELAIDGLRRSGLRFMPSAPELLTAAERSRRQLLAAHPHRGCAECQDRRGWRTVDDGHGQPMVERCPCVASHRAAIDELGLAESFTLLPGEAGVGESEQVYPTIQQLPAPLQSRLREIVSRKAIR